jgi:hypothetical protein
MKLFSRIHKSEEDKATEKALEGPVAGHGNIHGLNLMRKRGFVKDSDTGDSLFFNSAACADFDALTDGMAVTFMKETDPADRMRVHAIDIKAA